MNSFYLAIAILAEVVATSSLKAAEGFTKLWPSLVVISGYLIAFYCLSLTLRTIPVGVAYAIWSGAGIVLISLAGLIFYKQYLNIPSLIGMGLILVGVVLLNLISN